MKQLILLALALGAVAMAGCSAANPPPTAISLPPAATIAPATDTPAPTSTMEPVIGVASTGVASPTAPPIQAVTVIPSITPSRSTATTPGAYLDDRSTPVSLMQSYVNALNRKEYVHAYYYWRPGAAQLPPYGQFQQGYADTASVRLTLGPIGADAGAGQLYWSVPVLLTALTTRGATQTFLGCYVLHLSQPGIQGAPPFEPLSIDSATVKQVANNTDPGSVLPNACQALGKPQPPTVAPSPTYAPNDIGQARYLDDRSDPIQVLRSFYNAINRKEYARAYSYWQPDAAATQIPPFDQFQNGYGNTASAQLTTGAVTNDIGAGQIYWTVPVTLVARTTNGASQTFVGCYTVHLAQPLNQAPPFQPMSITAAKINSVPNGADTVVLMNAACH